MSKRTQRGAGAASAALLALTLGACDFISPTEADPNKVPTSTVDQLFTGIQVRTFFIAEGQLSRITSIWTQQMAGTDRQFATLDAYVFAEDVADDEFSGLYTGGGLIDLRRAIAQAEEAERRVYAGILKIHQAYMFGMGASLFGDLPYTEAAVEGVEDPALDTQADVYAGVQALLDEAIADLASGTGLGPGAVDLNFEGDATRWTAVAHSLKARFHLHQAEAQGNAAYQAALAEAQQGIQTTAGDWRAIHTAAATEQNPWYQFQRDRSGYISSGDYLVPRMVADDDPRLPFYFTEASGGGYVSRDSNLSPDGFGAPDFNSSIVSCAETAYIRAEALYHLGDEAGARSAAEEGLACEEARWGVSLAGERQELAAASGAGLLEEIMNQKYVALFLNIETWNDYKRTCLPDITPRAGGVPGRLFYGQAERQANSNIPEPAQQPARNANDPAPCT